MLQYIRIKNLALMDEVTLDFEEGFTVVTGETGAGKSVLLGALAILAGNRVEKSVIRQGTDLCEVEATLYFPKTQRIDSELEALGLPLCEDGALVLRRTIATKKAGRIQINGAMATLTALQQLGELWIDFHGPGEPQKLFKDRYQLEMLDLFARNQTALQAYQADYRNWRQLLQQAEDLKGGEQLSEDEIEFIQNQINTIDQLELDEESLESLERDYNRLDKARELAEYAGQLSLGISGESGITAQLTALRRYAADLSEIDSEANSLTERLDSLLIELEDLGAEYDQLSGSVDFDPETAEAIQNRMHQWLEIKRKYGPELSTVIEKRNSLEQKIAMQSDIEGTLSKLAQAASKQEKELITQAGQLYKSRQKAAKTLAQKAQKLMTQLGFKKADFSIDLIPEEQLKDYGNCHCAFLFSPNTGQQARPLNKIASSGETARVMLALKAVLAKVDATPVLVFDEVDANVGGEIGAEVGRELAALAAGHQVFCVTHLPQVAAQGKEHYVVTKAQDKKSTHVSISPIHNQKEVRETELARMLGDRTSAAALSHARELLNKK